ncbi:hypothetical protein Tco_0127959 [Tanacetum coccineum]
MSVRQVWKRKTPLLKSSPTCHNDSPPPPPTNTPYSISPPMNYPQRDQIINQLYTISTLIDSQTPTPPSSPHLLVSPPTNAQEGGEYVRRDSEAAGYIAGRRRGGGAGERWDRIGRETHAVDKLP